ncbi:DMT family transporter [Agarilytica rhodophyticola]|uniref:DMT family transporter n=1 Tax=Agarilytica rhodophyticola TaxID=1737490 RepID=UPI001C1FE65F|nr:DMT family transporter [Agarilytica rhodophyticola]
MSDTQPIKIIFFTALALTAFAANSVLCRLALLDGAIDPGSFTSVRLISGITTLLLIFQFTRKKDKLEQTSEKIQHGSWLASLMLFIYAAAFSFAYVFLDTGTGALILFAAVQITMIAVSVVSGKSLHYSELLGVFVAFCGFVYLVAPEISKPSLTGFVLMTLAGCAWGVYTLKGRGSLSPVADTYYNFLRTLPLAAILFGITLFDAKITSEGLFLAVMSGAVASGIGYSIWYAALTGLSALQAAVLQLLVPVIATAGGLLFAKESLSYSFVFASLMILGGILIVIAGQRVIRLLSASG